MRIHRRLCAWYTVGLVCGVAKHSSGERQGQDRTNRGLASVLYGRGLVIFMEAANRARIALPPSSMYEHLLYLASSALSDSSLEETLRRRVPWVRLVSDVETPTIVHMLANVFLVQQWHTVLYMDQASLFVRDFGSTDPVHLGTWSANRIRESEWILAAHSNVTDSVAGALKLESASELFDASMFVAQSKQMPTERQLERLTEITKFVDLERRLYESLVLSTLLNGSTVASLDASYANIGAGLLVRLGETWPLVRRASADFILNKLASSNADRLTPKADMLLMAASRHTRTFIADLTDSLGLWPQWTTNVSVELPQVSMLQLIEKLGVVCDGRFAFSQLMLLPRFCCCRLNVLDHDQIRKFTDLDVAASVASNAILSTATAKIQRDLSRSIAASFKRPGLFARVPCSPDGIERVPDHSTAVQKDRADSIQAVCEPTVRPCRAVLADHHCSSLLSRRPHSTP